MKNILILIILFLCISYQNSFAYEVDSLGIDWDPVLNRQEAEFFNNKFIDYQDKFDFHYKKIAYVSFEESMIFSDYIVPYGKKHYFKYFKNDKRKELIVLNRKQKINLKGYDAIILLQENNQKFDRKNLQIIIDTLEGRNKLIPKHLTKLGIDSNLVLNEYEGNYLNYIFNKRRKGFNFVNKKIAFFYGNYAHTLSNKNEYFESIKNRTFRSYSLPSDQLIFLDDKEKQASNGYDVIIISWSKIRVTKFNRTMLEKLINIKP